MKLVVVTHVRHYWLDGHYYAYAPYAREIEIWADLFQDVLIAAPLCDSEPAGDCVAVRKSNIRVLPQRDLGGETWGAKIKLICFSPVMAWELAKALKQGDAIHVRCPGNLGLLGAILAPLFSRRIVAKFAGQWNTSPVDPLTVRLQKAVLSSRWWHGPVTVYGKWPNLPAHVVPFFSSALTADQVERGKAALKKRTRQESSNILFVGRLSQSKNVHILLQALAQIQTEGTSFKCAIVGEGPEYSALRALAAELDLRDSVEFAGGLSHEDVLDRYERSGILVLASQTEGWPKAITEGMAFGLIVIGSNLGLIPEMLTEDRGFLVKPRDVDGLVSTLRQILADPESHSFMRYNAAAWSYRYSLDALRDSLQALFAEHWGVSVTRDPHPRDVAPSAFR